MEKEKQIPVILIVDDNPQNLQVLGKLLQENKYDIEFATNGKAALDWLSSKPFDLILLDINMPGMSGFEVCTQIRLNPVLNKVPVIFLTAESDRESILKGFEIGAQDYITKPFDGRELLSRVRTHITLKVSLENLANINELLEEKVLERTRQLCDANKQLETTNLRLIDLDKAKTEFLNLISHEIRTPLNGILGPLELLKDSGLGSEISELVNILDESVKRLERFSLDALLITKLKTRNSEIRIEKIQLSDLINDVLNSRKKKLESGNIEVEYIEKPASTVIHGEKELIKKCFENILDNAITYSPSGSKVKINTYVEERNTLCEITDQGKGIDAKVLSHPFELFTTSDEYKDNSIGIGFSILHMIMEAHGGSISLGNEPGGGALVKLIFRNELK